MCFAAPWMLLAAAAAGMITSLQASVTSRCPVMPAGLVGQCHCTPLVEIHCHHLDSVPRIELGIVTSLWDEGIVLRGLYLSRQHIESLPPGAFSSLPVNRLVLNFNNIGDNIDPDTFVDRPDLESAWTVNDIRHAQSDVDVLWRLPDQSYSEFKQKRHRRHVSVLGLTLTELYMGACRIRNLPARLFHQLINLKRLHLWANNIETLPARVFRYNSHLVELSLWGNQLEELDSNLFDGLQSLRRLDLDRNRLTSLTDQSCISRLDQLTKLSLNGNRIHALSFDSFRQSSALRVLNLDSNGLGYVYGNTMQSLVNLSSLSMRHNAVHILPDDMFSGLVRLTELRLDYNRIEHVWSRTFHGLRSLVRLWMTSNKLSHVPDGAFRESTRLKHVFLSGNSLTSLDRCAFSDGSLMRTLAVDGNAMRCDCRLAWLNALSRHGGDVSGTCQQSDQTTVHLAAFLHPDECNIMQAANTHSQCCKNDGKCRRH